MILRENLFWKTSNRGLSRSPSTKNRDKLHLFPQTIPSITPTGLFRPLPPQTFGLLLGRSSLTSKKITVHPEIIDSDYKREIQIIMSSQILWQFKKRDKIAQLLLLPYIPINSSNDTQTNKLRNTDQKQSLWTSLLSEYAQPKINIKIHGKKFSGLLDTISDITIIGHKRFLAKLQEFLKLKYKMFIKVFKFILVRDQKASLLHYNLMW